MPNIRPLPNKPLIEAILELRWSIEVGQEDPNYALFPGTMFSLAKESYPEHVSLPSSVLPQPMSVGIVQHQFRASKQGWPLIQVGPGIVTLNDTDGYIWSDFGQRAKMLVDQVYEAYQNAKKLNVSELVLRYIDAVHLDDMEEDIFKFLREKLKTRIEWPDVLFSDVPVERNAKAFSTQSTFEVIDPAGEITVKFATGAHNNENAIIWETIFRSKGDQVPDMPNTFSDWVEKAHNLTDDWFFKLIEGDLDRRFANE